MGKSYQLKAKKVARVKTKYRTIATAIPAPASLPVLEKLRRYEPRSMSGQPLAVWDRAEGVNVYDRHGNRWLDFSSGVLVTNAGHGAKEIVAAIRAQIDKPLLHNYCFPSELRARLVEKLSSIAPRPLHKVFLLTTGSEVTECALKLARTWGRGKGKKVVVSFTGAFHGRTLGAQMMGGTPSLKDWVVNPDRDMVQVPFPGDPRCRDRRFPVFEKVLADRKVSPRQVCMVIVETYQGGNAAFLPVEYAAALRKWCTKNDVLLTFDEVQAGFGRSGKLFAFEHYGVVPDMVTLGKGISSSLPISALIGRDDIMDLYEPGTMTSTHTGNPLCCAAALASLGIIQRKRLVENAARLGPVFERELNAIQKRFPAAGFVTGRGLVWGLHIVKPGTEEPDGDLAHDIVGRCIEKGLMLFAPVGMNGGTIKISPPLIITREAVVEGCRVIAEAIREATER